MDFNQYFENFREVYDRALDAITDLRENAQEICESMQSIIDSCENIENEF